MFKLEYLSNELWFWFKKAHVIIWLQCVQDYDKFIYPWKSGAFARGGGVVSSFCTWKWRNAIWFLFYFNFFILGRLIHQENIQFKNQHVSYTISGAQQRHRHVAGSLPQFLKHPIVTDEWFYCLLAHTVVKWSPVQFSIKVFTHNWDIYVWKMLCSKSHQV